MENVEKLVAFRRRDTDWNDVLVLATGLGIFLEWIHRIRVEGTLRTHVVLIKVTGGNGATFQHLEQGDWGPKSKETLAAEIKLQITGFTVHIRRSLVQARMSVLYRIFLTAQDVEKNGTTEGVPTETDPPGEIRIAFFEKFVHPVALSLHNSSNVFAVGTLVEQNVHR